MRDALLEQHAAFRAKFGRDPCPSDPIFFDPDADTLVPMTARRAANRERWRFFQKP